MSSSELPGNSGSAGRWDYVNKINALMANAEQADNEELRNRFLAKAEALRAKHKIDEAALRAAGGAPRDRIVHGEWEVQMRLEIEDSLSRLIGAVMSHYNMRGVWRGWGADRKLVWVGLESDVAMAERLWVMLYLELVGNMYPTWDKDRPFDENVYRQVNAGVKWQHIFLTARSAGEDVGHKLTGRFRAAYVRECKRRGEPIRSHTSRHGAFRASYANSFSSTIRTMLYQMRVKADTETRGGYALAVIDDEAAIDREFYRMYPHLDPEVLRKRQQEREAADKLRLEQMTPEQRAAEAERLERETARARKIHERMRDKSYDPAGWQHGRKVAEKVDLTMGSNGLPNDKKELG